MQSIHLGKPLFIALISAYKYSASIIAGSSSLALNGKSTLPVFDLIFTRHSCGVFS
tara:strand:- start:273 stop:440 length:168 start_codon:yes stop_codon:yes gene_type:complete